MAQHTAPEELGGEPDGSDVVRPSWTTKLDVIGQPVVAGPVAVVIARTERRGVEMVALDADTGKVRWRLPHSPGILSTYYSFEPVVVHTTSGQDRVIVQEPNRLLLDGYSYSAVKVVDPRNGQVLHETGQLASHEPLGECDDGQDVCGVGYAGEYRQPFRWNVTTGTITALAGVADARDLGSGLFSTSDRPGEELFVLRRGKPAWRLSVVDLFGSRATSDRGWSFDDFDGVGVLVGTIGRAFPDGLVARYEAGDPVTYSVQQHQQLLGLDVRTGRVLWRLPRVQPSCVFVVLAHHEERPPVACLYEGTAREEKGEKKRYQDLGVELRGFDPRTGETTWSVVGTRRFARRLANDDDDAMVAGGVALETATGLVAVDLRAGTTRPLAGDLVLWCSGDAEQITLRHGGVRDGGHLYRRCTPDGTSTDGPLSREGVAAVPSVRGLRVVSVAGKVLGFRT